MNNYDRYQYVLTKIKKVFPLDEGLRLPHLEWSQLGLSYNDELLLDQGIGAVLCG